MLILQVLSLQQVQSLLLLLDQTAKKNKVPMGLNTITCVPSQKKNTAMPNTMSKQHNNFDLVDLVHSN